MIINKFQVIEIPINTTNLSYKFPDQPNLRNVPIFGIQVYLPSFILATPVTGSTPATLADLKKCTITLQEGNYQTIQNRPILCFQDVVDGTAPYTNFQYGINGLIFSWDKCTINFASAPGTGSTVVSLGIYYSNKGVDTNI